MQKKILIIEDLSSIGRTSLATAIPIITAYGHESVAVPSALLSANTAFKGFTYLDLTGEMVKILKHLNSLSYEADALYTGYLGSSRQVDIISNYLKDHPKLNYYLDPAFADDGKLYDGFDQAFVGEIKKLIAKAKLIMPNLTEAEMLLGVEAKANYLESDILKLLKGLTSLGPKMAIITGVLADNNTIANYAYDRQSEKLYSYSYERLPNSYYGTGDIFASLITGAMEANLSLDEALKLAGDFLYKAIEHSNLLNTNKLYGVCFEPYLSQLGGKAHE